MDGIEGLIACAVLIGVISIILRLISTETKVSDGYGGKYSPAPMAQANKISGYGLMIFIFLVISILCVLSQEVLKLWQNM